MLRFLGGYVIDHFSAEEDYMIDYKYPEYDFHKEEHMQLLKTYKKVMIKYKKEGVTSSLLKETVDHLVNWLYEHIMRTDKNLADFLMIKT